MDDELKEKLRKANDEMGTKIKVGYPGRKISDLPDTPNQRGFPDDKNPNIKQSKKEA